MCICVCTITRIEKVDLEFIVSLSGGVMYDIGWSQKLFLKCSGSGLPTGWNSVII